MKSSLIKRPYYFGEFPRTDFDHLFDQFFTTPSQLSDSDFHLKCDVEETKSDLLFSFDVPGVDKEDMKIDFQDGVLSVSGERNKTFESGEKGVSRTERYYGRFERSFRVTQPVDSDGIEAHFENGVLEVKLPKREVVEKKGIEIKSHPEGGFFSRLLSSDK